MVCVTIRDPGIVSPQERFADHESKLSIMLWADHHQVDAPYLSYNLLPNNHEAVLDVKNVNMNSYKSLFSFPSLKHIFLWSCVYFIKTDFLVIFHHLTSTKIVRPYKSQLAKVTKASLESE